MDASEYRTPGAEEAYNRYADMMFRIAFSILKSKEDSEDVVSEVFSGYIKKPPAFREKEHEKAWFVRVTINRCHDHQRRCTVRSYTPLEEITEIPADDTSSIDILTDILSLPEKYKSAINLHYFEDFSIEEISGMLGISKSAVKMRLSRGRDLLKNEAVKRGV